MDFALVAASAIVICTVATIYPALAAASIRPVDGLRFE
jgi:lipoprotein-releasing system permease protein